MARDRHAENRVCRKCLVDQKLLVGELPNLEVVELVSLIYEMTGVPRSDDYYLGICVRKSVEGASTWCYENRKKN